MKRVKTILLDLAFMAAGAVVYAVSVNAFTSPNNIAPGGVTGIATMLNYLFSTPIGLVAFLINIPIILWAVVEIGYKLVAKSVAAILLSSVAIDLLAPIVPSYQGNMILVALFAGLCEGLGLSLTFLRGATTGGTDMLARLLGRRKPHLSMGKLMLAVDGVVVAVSAFVFGSVENAMYACIVIFVSTKLIDAILYGADAGTGKLFFVMSPKVRQMGQRVIGELERTVTYLDSHGGYTNEPRGDHALRRAPLRGVPAAEHHPGGGQGRLCHCGGGRANHRRGLPLHALRRQARKGAAERAAPGRQGQGITKKGRPPHLVEGVFGLLFPTAPRGRTVKA